MITPQSLREEAETLREMYRMLKRCNLSSDEVYAAIKHFVRVQVKPRLTTHERLEALMKDVAS